jgi:hypothetical protein
VNFTIWTRQKLKSVGSLSQFHSVMVHHKHSRPTFFTKAHLGSSIKPFGGLKGRALRVFGQLSSYIPDGISIIE